METLGKITAFIVTVTLGALINGFVIMKLYGWFIVPVFGTPGINVIESIGISILISYLTNKKSEDEGKPALDILRIYTLKVIITASIALMIGYIIQLFL